MAEALYRKYRPQVFEDVVGQEHIERTIKNAIERDKVSHAYLFTGPRGTGKTTTARLLAKALLCERGPTPEPDGTCEDCELIASGEHPDVYELDAASRTGVENVREEIIGRVQFAPTRGRYKIYIIDEVHMLSTAAFNALLKTLEEPPSHVVFILATTDPQKVPETIHSRCQRFDFRRISNESIAARLGAICVAEGVEYEEDALDLIAHRAEGGLRNALTSLEQLIAFGEGSVSMAVAERMLGSLDSSDLAEIVRFVGTRDVAACFKWTADFVETGSDLAQFTRDFAEHVRNLYVLSLAGAEAALDVTAAARREMLQELPLFGPDRLARLLGVLGDLSAELKTSTNPRLSFEIALTRMVRPESDLTLEGLAARIEALESSGPIRSGGMGAYTGAAVLRDDRLSQGSGDRQVEAGFSSEAPRASSAPKAGVEAVERPRQAMQETPKPVRVENEAEAFEGGPAREAALSAARESHVEALPASNVVSSASGLPDQLVAQLANPAALQRLWQTVLASLKKTKTAYGVLFLNTKAVFDEATGSLVIDFPVENEFAFKAVQKPDVQDELGRCIAAACGVELPFSLKKGGAAGAFATESLVRTRPAVRDAARAVSVSEQPPRSGDRVEADVNAFRAAPAQSARSMPEQNPSSAPAARAIAVSESYPAQSTPEYDGPPLDSYDDYVPYGDDGYGSSADLPPWDEPASAQQPVQQVKPASAQRPQTPSAQPQSQPRPEPAAVVESASAEPSASDLDAALAFGFGAGITFTEV